jgi:protein-tyrosine phosphatase
MTDVIDLEHTTLRGATWNDGTPFQVPVITQISPNLWLGGSLPGQRVPLPPQIVHLVSMIGGGQYMPHGEVQSSLALIMNDSVGEDYPNLDGVANWVNACRETGAVLVHCQVGLNRSALVVARALHLSSGLPGAKILKAMRAQRSHAVLHNPTFEQLVLSWEARNASTAETRPDP